MLDSIIDKISSYNILNNLLPGGAFVFLIKIVVNYSMFQNDLLYDFILVYLLGVIMNRLGSLLIEPLFTKLKLIKKKDYKNYLNLKDDKMQNLVETSNVYRSLVSTILVVTIISIYFTLIRVYIDKNYETIIFILMIFALFSMSYIKQQSYISERIKIEVEKNNENSSHSL